MKTRVNYKGEKMKIYRLKSKWSFTLDTQEWHGVILDVGDEVMIDGHDISIRCKGDIKWELTIDMVNPFLMEQLEETRDEK